WASTWTRSARTRWRSWPCPTRSTPPRPRCTAKGYREGVLVVPYSMALPFLLALYRLIVRFGAVADGEPLAGRLAGLQESLPRGEEEVEGRLSRGLAQAENARDALRGHLADARRAAFRAEPARV